MEWYKDVSQLRAFGLAFLNALSNGMPSDACLSCLLVYLVGMRHCYKFEHCADLALNVEKSKQK